MKVAVLGMGNMGSKYAALIAQGKVKGMELEAVTRIRPERMESLKGILPDNLKIYESAEKLFSAYDAGELELDAVLVVTPHYSHEELAKLAFARGLSVLCDKPAGVYSRQARNMMNAYKQAKQKYTDLKYGFVFHQRTFPVYKKMREIVSSKKYGELKRVNWVVTDWYRSNAYYESGSWRATWGGDGGGTLLNQCPHNLDLLQWICGMPERVCGFCHEGKFHPIEVEDEVTAYMEWKDGATGVFIASTGEAAGVNRLEISLDNALLVCEKGELSVFELDKPESEYRNGTGDLFAKPKVEQKKIECGKPEGAYEKVLSDFAAGVMTADGSEAINSLYLSNAIYLSSWENRTVDIPKSGTQEELKFEKSFESRLAEKAGKHTEVSEGDDYRAKAEIVEKQEKELQFDKFDSEDAVRIGTALIDEAKRRNNKICLDIQIAGRRLFHFSSDGNASSNDVMIERKKNTAMHTGHSSLWAHYMLKSMGLSIDEKWHLDPSQYAEVGGAFPIRLKNCPTAIGTITVSGFDHTVDHGIIIDVLRKML